jgi:hypothetical protein
MVASTGNIYFGLWYPVVIALATDHPVAESRLPVFSLDAIAEIADPMIEQAAVTKHSEEDRLQEPAVGRAQLAALRVTLDQGFGVVMALGPCA